MGQEVWCKAWFGEQASEGKALLESDALIFRGDFKLRVPFKTVQSIDARDGLLELVLTEGVARLELGSRAEQWAAKIRNPKSLLDKLGVKAGSRISVLGIDDVEFWQQLRARSADVADGELSAESDFIFFLADEPEDLGQLSLLREQIKPNGAIWVISPKRKPAIKDVVVMAAAKEAGFVDVKVAAFSSTHTALKLVIPRAKR
jgi:hypothetical protein